MTKVPFKLFKAGDVIKLNYENSPLRYCSEKTLRSGVIIRYIGNSCYEILFGEKLKIFNVLYIEKT